MTTKVNLDDEYPSNSDASRRVAPIRESRRKQKKVVDEEVVEPKRVKKSIAGRATRQKRSMSQQIAHKFLGEDTQNVGSYIVNDVLIPAAKTTIQEMITSGIEMMLFGERQPRGRDRDRGRSTVSYGSYYKERDRKEERRPSYRGDKFDLDDIFFRHGDEAAEVLSDLCDLLEEYEQVTVADFFELSGIEGASWAHNKYGWEDLRKARVTHTRQGYLILFPKPIELD